MSMQLVGQVVGGVIGAYVGSPALGMAIGGYIGGQFDPKPVTEGPRLSDVKISDSAYGKGIPWVAGKQRVAAQLMWSTKKLKEIRVTTVAGKGGGPVAREYMYFFTGAVALCQAPEQGIVGLGQGWAAGEVVFDARSVAAELGFAQAGKSILPYMTFYNGAWDQLPDPTMQLYSPNCSAYRGVAYIMFTDLPVKNFGNRFPNLEFEVIVGEKKANVVDYGTPELLSYVDDNGSQQGLRLMMNGDNTDTLFAMQIKHAGGFTFSNYYSVFTLPVGKKARGWTGLGIGDIPSQSTPPMFYGSQVDALTPADQRGQQGIEAFTIKSRRPLYGLVRKAKASGYANEVFACGMGSFPHLMFNDGAEPPLYPLTPAFAVVIDRLAFFTTASDLNKLYKAQSGIAFPFYDFAPGEEIQSFADAGALFYVATRDATKVRVYQFDAEGPTSVVVEHYFYSNTIRIHATVKGVVYLCFAADPIFDIPGMLEISKWDPQMDDGFEIVGRVKPTWTVGSGEGYEHLGDAQGQPGHVGAAGSGSKYDFFWTDGARAIFDAGVGTGNNEGYGGDGICGVVFGDYTKFGGDIEDVTVGSIVANRCRAAGLPDDAFDVSELHDEVVDGYTVARTLTARGTITPLQTYLPFDVVESGARITFPLRGKAEVMTIDVESIGVDDET